MPVIFVAFILVATSGLVVARPYNALYDDDDYYLSHLLKCKRGQKLLDLQKCVKDSIESMQYYFKRGHRHYLTKTDYFYYKGNYTFNRLANFESRLTLYDIIIEGLSNYIINNVRLTRFFHQIQFSAEFPHLALTANYHMEGTIREIRVSIQKGQRMNAELLRSEINVTINGHFNHNDCTDKDIKRYFKIDTVKVNLNVPWTNYYLANTNEDEDKHEEIFIILWGNQFNIMAGIINHLRSTIASKIQSIADKIYSNIPMDILMPGC